LLFWQDVDRDTPMSVTNPEEARTFDEVIVGLQRSYPGDKLAEISTSFCFICLLHLANECGLKLESGNVAAGPFSPTPAVKEDEKIIDPRYRLFPILPDPASGRRSHIPRVVRPPTTLCMCIASRIPSVMLTTSFRQTRCRPVCFGC